MHRAIALSRLTAARLPVFRATVFLERLPVSTLSSLAILGCGNMAQAILQGVLRAGLVPAERVTIW